VARPLRCALGGAMSDGAVMSTRTSAWPSMVGYGSLCGASVAVVLARLHESSVGSCRHSRSMAMQRITDVLPVLNAVAPSHQPDPTWLLLALLCGFCVTAALLLSSRLSQPRTMSPPSGLTVLLLATTSGTLLASYSYRLLGVVLCSCQSSRTNEHWVTGWERGWCALFGRARWCCCWRR